MLGGEGVAVSVGGETVAVLASTGVGVAGKTVIVGAKGSVVAVGFGIPVAVSVESGAATQAAASIRVPSITSQSIGNNTVQICRFILIARPIIPYNDWLCRHKALLHTLKKYILERTA